jgi:hypothetical protein
MDRNRVLLADEDVEATIPLTSIASSNHQPQQQQKKNTGGRGRQNSTGSVVKFSDLKAKDEEFEFAADLTRRLSAIGDDDDDEQPQQQSGGLPTIVLRKMTIPGTRGIFLDFIFGFFLFLIIITFFFKIN